MTPELVLLALRLLSALLLLGFLGVIAWLMYQDLRAASPGLSDVRRQYGRVLVLASDENPNGAGVSHPLLPVTSIGRAASNTLVLDDEFASAEHALISLHDSRWWLEDLGSRNGTLLNEVPITGATVIAAGDIITVGSTRFKIEPG